MKVGEIWVRTGVRKLYAVYGRAQRQDVILQAPDGFSWRYSFRKIAARELFRELSVTLSVGSHCADSAAIDARHFMSSFQSR